MDLYLLSAGLKSFIASTATPYYTLEKGSAMHNKIIIVDNNTDILDSLSRILKLKGFEAIPLYFATENEIIEHIKLHQPHILIFDIWMLSVNGIALCKKIKTMQELKMIPVILFSAAYSNEQLEDECIDDFIEKPFEIDDLIEKVNRLLTLSATV